MPKDFTGSIKTGEDDTWEYFDTYVDGAFTTKSLKMKPVYRTHQEWQRLAFENYKKWWAEKSQKRDVDALDV